jgi:hypothetical protein
LAKGDYWAESPRVWGEVVYCARATILSKETWRFELYCYRREKLFCFTA